MERRRGFDFGQGGLTRPCLSRIDRASRDIYLRGVTGETFSLWSDLLQYRKMLYH